MSQMYIADKKVGGGGAGVYCRYKLGSHMREGVQRLILKVDL